MKPKREFTPSEIEEIGVTLYGDAWKAPLARAMGVPRQTADHYLAHGVRGTQATALLGVVARVLADHRGAMAARQAADLEIEAILVELYERFRG